VTLHSVGGLIAIIANRRRFVLWLMVFAAMIAAQATFADDNSVVLEIGGAGAWDAHTWTSQFGPNFAVEVTQIEHKLENETGTSPVRVKGATEWETVLVFKRPFELSSTADFM